MNREQLIEVIEKAFDGVTQPDEITLHVAEAHDGYDYANNEMHRGKDYFGRWQDVPEDRMCDCQSALSHFDAVGMKFYLPAFMVWYLKHLGNFKVSNDGVLYTLDNNPDNKQLNEYHKARFSLFSAEQLHACALFVKFCFKDELAIKWSDPYFAQEKFEKYWVQFEKI